MKHLLLSLTLIISANAWAGICDGPSANKPDYKEYCEGQKRKEKDSKSKKTWKIDWQEACEGNKILSKECGDALDAYKSSTSKTDKSEKNPTGKRISSQEIRNLDKARNPYKDYSNQKAVAIADNKDLKGYVCHSHNSLSGAISCAIDGCEAQGEACVIILENNSFLEEEVIKTNLERARRNFNNSKEVEKDELPLLLNELQPESKCVERIENAKKNFLKTCRAPGTTGSDAGELFYQINYCRTQANDRYDPMSCFKSDSKETSTTYTLWLTGNNNVRKYASFKDYGSCMNRCRNLKQLCTCKAD